MRVALVVAALFAIPVPAIAADFQSCWVTKSLNPDTGFEDQITRCRNAGGNVIDYPSDSAVPAVLSPNLGSDDNGTCWYLTSAETPYEFLTRYGDGTADIIYDPNNSDDAVMVAANLRRCTSEPIPDPPPEVVAWNYVMSYIHDPPTPDLNPQPGEGVTGLATYVGVEVPEDHEASLTGVVSTIDVQIRVDTVVVDWGNGNTTTYPPDPEILAGYPDGTATHTYQTKSPDGIPLTVEYDWTARWRVSGGEWTALSVPNTTTTTDYPVAEVVSRLTD